MGENIIVQAKEALKARELVKGKVLENSTLSPQEVCDMLFKECKADGVQVIGSKFVIYKKNQLKPIIELPKKEKKK